VENEALMFKLIRASFNQRRKTMTNSLKNAADLSYTKEQIIEALEQIGEKETVRGEALSLEQFGQLSDVLNKM
jgi:16S rRNA (adenine1518-N6/adenine1519-N6)-dimethyltransferase